MAVKPVRGSILFGVGFLSALALGWIGFPRALYRTIEQPLGFSHHAHGPDGAGVSCEDCHAIRDDGQFAGIPRIAKCAECHGEVLGTTADEQRLVEEYVKPAREIPWLVYARQPDNVRFSHAIHVRRGKLTCAECHGPHGTSAALPAYQQNRITGYSRDIWGPSLSRFGREPWQGKKMTDCSRCHAERGVRESCLDCHR
jgi:hypothetical protein